jgi:putative phosphoribosyl transferase
VHTPAFFFGVGQWYEDFSQTTDEEVRELLKRAPVLEVSHGHHDA